MLKSEHTSGWARASLVSGVLGFFTCGLTVLPAIICGHISRSKIRQLGGSTSEQNSTQSGLLLGYLGIVVWTLFYWGGNERRKHGIADSVAMNRTYAFEREIISGLENYHDNWGEYPSPEHPNKVATFNGRSYNVGGALMLYQALSGDGNDHLKMKQDKSPEPSDGMTSDSKRRQVRLVELPVDMYRKIDGGYVLVDGFGRPLQYTPGGANSVNSTYDLWSFGQSENREHLEHADKKAKLDGEVTKEWLKNW